MSTHVAFLRAINVGGRSIVKMDTLRDVFERAGGTSVRTFIQSGNVVFDAPVANVSRIVARVGALLHEACAVRPEILVRSAREVQELVSLDPFTNLRDARQAKLYVAFLLHKPKRVATLPLVSTKEAVEVIGLSRREAFIVSRLKKNGMFGFPNGFVEEHFGGPATTRNWSTVTKIAALTLNARSDTGARR